MLFQFEYRKIRTRNNSISGHFSRSVSKAFSSFRIFFVRLIVSVRKHRKEQKRLSREGVFQKSYSSNNMANRPEKRHPRKRVLWRSSHPEVFHKKSKSTKIYDILISVNRALVYNCTSGGKPP